MTWLLHDDEACPPTDPCSSNFQFSVYSRTQVDTFEAVKNNIFDMLGDLAQDFNDEQLDLLFSKFEVNKGRPVPDSIKIMDLMRRLAKSDTKASPQNFPCRLFFLDCIRLCFKMLGERPGWRFRVSLHRSLVCV